MVRNIILAGIVCVSILSMAPGGTFSQAQRDRFNQDQGFDRERFQRGPQNRQQKNEPLPDQQKRSGQQGNQPDVLDDYYQNLTPQQRQCMDLEKQLAQSWLARSKGRENLPKMDEELQEWEQKFLKSKAQAERSDCYREVFIFGKELRDTPKCRKLGREIEDARIRMDDLLRQKQSLMSGDRGQEDYIISRLAEYGCGKQYEDEDRRRNPSLFSFGRSDDDRNGDRNSSIIPFATYRTMCVRTCDGFYYPVSFSTLPSRFPLDEATCQSKCAAPAELYVYKNPGEEIAQMMSLKGQPYSETPFAFRFQKEFVKGCSCKTDEYSPEALGLGKNGSGANQTVTGKDKNSPPADKSAGAGQTRRQKENPAPGL